MYLLSILALGFATLSNQNMHGLEVNGYLIEPGADLSGADLSATDLTDANLADADLRDAALFSPILLRTDFTGANFTGQDLGGCEFDGSILRGADFSGAYFLGNYLAGIDFEGAIFTNTSFLDTYIVDVRFNGADFTDANFEFSYIDLVDFGGADLRGTRFFECDFFDSRFEEARVNELTHFITSTISFSLYQLSQDGVLFGPGLDYSGADFSGMNFSGADFESCSFGYTNLTGANLSGASFLNASLFHTVLTGADVQGVDFSEVQQFTWVASGGLSGITDDFTAPYLTDGETGVYRVINGYFVGPAVDLRGADLSGQDISQGATAEVPFSISHSIIYNADFSDADLSFTLFNGVSGDHSILENASLEGSIFGGASFVGANFSGSLLIDAVFNSTNLSGALLTGADLNNADLTNQGIENGQPLMANVQSGLLEGIPLALPVDYQILYGYLTGPGITPAVNLILDDAETIQGNVVTIGFKASAFLNLSGLQSVIEWDATKLSLVTQGATVAHPRLQQVASVEVDGSSHSIVNVDDFSYSQPGQLQILWNDNLSTDGSGISLPDDMIVFALSFVAEGDPGTQTDVVFNPVPSESLAVVTSENGNSTPFNLNLVSSAQVTFDTSAKLSGIVSYMGDSDRPIANVQVDATSGSDAITMTSDQNGGFEGSFAFVPGAPKRSYEVQASHASNSDGAVNVVDMIHLRKHILGKKLLDDPFSLVAADVDRNHSLDVLDLVLMRQYILGVKTYYSLGSDGNPASTWSFFSSAMSISQGGQFFSDMDAFRARYYTEEPWDVDAVDFAGVKLGDIDGSWGQGYAMSPTSSMLQGGESLQITDGQVLPNGMIAFEVTSPVIDGMLGFQGTLSWDASSMDLVHVNSGIMSGFNAATDCLIGNGQASVLWSSTDLSSALIDSELPMLKLFFKPTDGLVGSSLQLGSALVVDHNGMGVMMKPSSGYYYPEGHQKLTRESGGALRSYHHQHGLLGLELHTEVGMEYALEVCENLDGQEWTFLQTIIGTGASVRVEYPTAEGAQRFYRVRAIEDTVE